MGATFEQMNSELVSRVRAVVAEVLAVDPAGLGPDSRIREDLAADSLDQLSLFMAFEDEFGSPIPEEDLSRLETLGDVIEYVGARLEQGVERE